MIEARIQHQFFEAADLLNQCAEVLSRPLAAAVQAITGCLTAGGKLLIVGSDDGARLAATAAAALAGRFERERPPLAALALREEGHFTPATQVRALGVSGDVLLALDGGASQALHEAVDAAHERELIVVALTGPDITRWRTQLGETDVHLFVPHERRARVAEVQLLLVNALCDAIDMELLGAHDE